MKLYFVPAKFPRTTTREEWKKIWRWKRVTEQTFRHNEEEMIKYAHHAVLYGTAWGQFKDDIFTHLINPPLVVHDKQEAP